MPNSKLGRNKGEKGRHTYLEWILLLVCILWVLLGTAAGCLLASGSAEVLGGDTSNDSRFAIPQVHHHVVVTGGEHPSAIDAAANFNQVRVFYV